MAHQTYIKTFVKDSAGELDRAVNALLTDIETDDNSEVKEVVVHVPTSTHGGTIYSCTVVYASWKRLHEQSDPPRRGY